MANAFFHEKSKIIAVLGHSVEVCHIGSTAVPGMCAKPIIDILVGVSQQSDFASASRLLEGAGYVCFGECGRPGRIFFVKGSPEKCTHHLHLVVKGSDYWRDYLAFRDLLINSREAASQYAEAKQQIASRYADDREMYRMEKSFAVAMIKKKYLGYSEQQQTEKTLTK
jgi:GrpB-like predicted nucleotidyltransferase (UPF0157 family)